MQLKKPAVAGTLESSDAQIMVAPCSDGIVINIESLVKAQFGEAIEATVREVLGAQGITDAEVTVNDKGAMDLVLRARLLAAIARAAETDYDYKGEAAHG